MSDKRKRGRPRTFERERTVALAMENYWQEGLHALSVNEICRRARLSKPALYREFGGEDGLLDAALEHYAGAIIAPMAATLAPDRPYAETLEALLELLTAPREALPAGCLFAKMRGAPQRLGPLAGARVEAIARQLRAGYEASFSRAQGRGEARSDVAPRLAGRYLDTQVTTVLRQMAAGEEPARVRAQARLAFGALLPS